MSQEVFKRYEKKYLLTPEQETKFRAAIADHMKLDKFGLSTICNIYFDTDDFDLIRTSVEKPNYKEKLRLRSYNVPKSGDSHVFVEIKKKFDGVVYKRRVEMTLDEAEAYLYEGVHPNKDSQILRELDWFLKMNPVKPQVYLAYDREAYADKDQPDFRLTMDKNIRCRRKQLHLSEGSVGEPILEDGLVLVEIKIPGVMPLWMARVLSELEIYPVSISKYGTFYKDNADMYMTVVNNHKPDFDTDNSLVNIAALRTQRDLRNNASGNQ